MRKIFIVTILAVLLITLLFLRNNGTFIHLAYAADSYSNDIDSVEVWQWNGTAYELRHNLTSSGGTYRIYDNQTTKFVVNIMFNSTLAASTAEAISFTRVYMNITDGGTIWNDAELNNTSCALFGDFYCLAEEGVWNSTGKPTAGVTYACSVLYQGYY